MLGTTLETIPNRVPYLSAEPERVARWQPALSREPGFKVGIAWQGNRAYSGDYYRSIPLEEFAPLARCDGVRFFSLQQGFGHEQLRAVGRALGHRRLGTETRSRRLGVRRYGGCDDEPRPGDHFRHVDGARGRRWECRCGWHYNTRQIGDGCSTGRTVRGIQRCGCFVSRALATGRPCSSKSPRSWRAFRPWRKGEKREQTEKLAARKSDARAPAATRGRVAPPTLR